MIHDVSMPLREGMPVYSNNDPFKREVTRDMAKGDSNNQSRIEMGCHCGTHVDAPYHFEADGYPVPSIPPESLIGPARLIHVPDVDCIDVADLEKHDWTGVERVLFRTRNSDHWIAGGTFDAGYVYLTGEAAAFLVEKKVRLVGVDGLGVEQYGNKKYPTHHTLLRAGVTVIEGLYVKDVPAGDYTLFCGPLRLEGSDGAPARVFLVDL